MKRMMEIKKEAGHTHVWINFSSLDIIQNCMRKAYYALERDLRSDKGTPATIFGSAIHKALETWYSSPRTARQIPTNFKQKALKAAYSHEPEEELALKCIQHFALAAKDLMELDDDKRSIENGVEILCAYFRKYVTDDFVVASDDEGPIIEREVSYEIHKEPNLTITFFGTVDMVLIDPLGNPVVCDHKTTSSLGAQFYNRLHPNFQYTGYIWGATKALGFEHCNSFLINAIQVAKTKQDSARQFTRRTEDDFKELQDAVVWNVKKYLECQEKDIWPQNAPQPCTMYGKCTYWDICTVPKVLKENIIQAKYGDMI